MRFFVDNYMKKNSRPGIALGVFVLAVLPSRAAAGAPGDDPVPPDARTAGLLAAIDRGDTARVRSMLKDRLIVNVRDSDGASPLMYAALNTGTDCMKLLLRHGADPNARNNE